MARDSAALLKQYQRKLDEVELLQSDLEWKGAQLTKDMNSLAVEKRKLMDRIEKLTERKDIVVSEHALLRYLERVKGMDLEALKREVWSAEAEERLGSAIKALGGGEYTLSTHRVVIKRNVVVSVLPLR